jgi:hypothetical protein
VAGGGGGALKVAVTDAGFASNIVQVALPEQAPVHPVKVELELGVAVSATDVPVAKLALHVAPQLMPAGALVTVPIPAPESVTVSSTVAGGGGAEALNVAVTDVGAASNSVHAPVPEQAPVHPVKVELALGFAVSVTDVPAVKLALHVGPQLSPDGVLVTVPPPDPASKTVSGMAEAEVEMRWDEPQLVRRIERKATERRREATSA